jgi:radical SAM protein with 4Fe4S-binding SPASM domain
MLPDGTTVFCHMDFGLRHVVGNIFETSYDGLRQSETFRKVLRSRWAWDGDELCRSCRWAYSARRVANRIGEDTRHFRDMI